MKRDLDAKEKWALEAILDATSIGAVLEALSGICGEKAEHIGGYEDSEYLARKWDTACGRIGCMATERDIAALEF